MKFKTTRKEMCNCSFCIISFPYCDIQNIERYLTPIAYTSGVYGWNCDIYEPTSYNIQFTTGYRPFEYYFNSEAKKLGAKIKEKILKLEESLKSSKITQLPLLEAQNYVQEKIFEIIHDSYKEIQK